VLIGPGPMQMEMGVIEVVVVVKREEGNDGEKVGVRVLHKQLNPGYTLLVLRLIIFSTI